MDLYQIITDKVVSQMETAGSNWINPFNKGRGSMRPINAVTGKAYRGINTVLLNFTPFASNAWAGFNQWKAKGCTVKKGEKATMIVFFKMMEREVEGEKETFPLLRYFNVFNSQQVDGDFARKFDHRPSPVPVVEGAEALPEVDALIARLDPTIRHSVEGQAAYAPGLDLIMMPSRSVFRATPTSSATECYYSTLWHEMVHWTGHESRLGRKLDGRFGTEAYAFEELIAELGAAFICGELGISAEPRLDHAHYLNHWLRVIRNDKRAIFRAASLSRQAAEFLTGKVAEDLAEAA